MEGIEEKINATIKDGTLNPSDGSLTLEVLLKFIDEYSKNIGTKK